MTQYVSLFNQLLKDALAASIERVQLATPLVTEVDRQEAWHLLSYGLKQPDVWTPTRQLLLTLAPKMELAGFREEWIGYLIAAAEQGRTHDDLAATAEFALQSGLLYRMLTEYERAITWLTSSLANFDKLGDRRGQARVFNELAWIEHLRRNFDIATCYVEQALALLDEDDTERGMSYRVQGMIAIYQGRWLEAEEQHRKSLKIFERQQDLRKIAWATQNIGFSLRGQEKYQDAIDSFHQACAILEELQDEYHWSIAQIGLGLTYYYSGNASAAIHHFLRAESISHKLQDRLQLARIDTNLGLAYMLQGLHEQATRSFQTAIRFYHELGMISLVINSMDGLAASYIAQAQFSSAGKVIEEALVLLPQIVREPNYAYLVQSLDQHWQQAKKAEAMVFVAKANVS